MAVTTAAIVVSACGASSKQIAQARHAVYVCDETKLADAIKAFLKERMGSAKEQPGAKLVVSGYRWHTKTGVPKRKGIAQVGPGDLALQFLMAYEKHGNGWLIKSKVSVLSHVVGSPRGRQLTPNDADYPAWAQDKHDTLRVKLHDRLKGMCASVSYTK